MQSGWARMLLGSLAASGLVTVAAQTLTYLGNEGSTLSIEISSSYSEVASLAGRYYCNATDGEHGWEPWVSDGTPSGTFMLGDLNPGGEDSSPSNFTYWDDNVYFSTRIGSNCVLWKTDGTISGTEKVKEIPERLRAVQFRDAGEILYFLTTGISPSVNLWRTDGTEAGTFQIKTPQNFQFSLPHPGAVKGGVVFGGWHMNSNEGQELWLAENTTDTATLVKDINPGSAGSMANFGNAVSSEGSAYFTATDGLHGYELWKSDGTAEGTKMVSDLVPGSSGASPYLGASFWDSYTIQLPEYFSGTANAGLFVTDGTSSGTMKLSDAEPTLSAFKQFVELNGQTIFAAADAGTDDVELWGTDGTPVGTALIKDINLLTSSSVSLITAVGQYAYFRADDGVNGLEVWKTDGTAAGTVLVSDIYPGANGSAPMDLVPVGNYIFFTADDGIHGRELWAAGGELDGAQLYDLEPGSAGSDPNQRKPVKSGIVFHATTAAEGSFLWSARLSSSAAEARIWNLYE